MRRSVIAVALLGLLVMSAGCSAITGGGVNEERLQEDVGYADLWNGSTTTSVDVGKHRYRAVHRLQNVSTVELWGFRRFNNERPLDPAGLRFRFPNGTIVGPEAMSVSVAGSRTVIETPAPNGSLAYAAGKNGKRVRLAVPVDGSYEVILPAGGRVQYPLLGRVVPGHTDRAIVDGRVHLTWTAEAMNRDQLLVEYYLVRDLLLLGGLLAIAVLLGIVGAAYFLVQLRGLRRQREAVALED